MKNGKLLHEYNFFGIERTRISSSKAVAPGAHTFKYEFQYAGGKPGSGGNAILFIDGEKVGEGKIPKTQPFFYSADEGVDVGMDGETAVSDDYQEGDNRFTGKINKVTVATFK
jgi:arylsulfatase